MATLVEEFQIILQEIENSRLDQSNLERALIKLLTFDSKSEEHLKHKESAYYKLSQLYCKQNQPQQVFQIMKSHDFSGFNQTRAAKIMRQMIDQVAQLENTIDLQVDMCQFLIDQCARDKKNYLKHKMQIRLATLYNEQEKFTQGIEIIDKIVGEVRKADDKHLLLEIYLIESKLHFGQTNLAKAKASLTAARACSNTIYCPPHVQAEIDMMAGVLYAEERDYRTSYSYFYEAFEAFNNLEDKRALGTLKYMLLCKIMIGATDEVKQILTGKHGLKYAGRHLEAMKAISNSNQKKSLIEFTKVLDEFKEEIEGDKVIRLHIKQLYEVLLEMNLFQVIQPYSKVQIDYITQRMSIDVEIIQRKLSELILDKKIDGTLDQGNDCLILFDTVKHDNLYQHSLSLINNLNGVVDKLFDRVKVK
ncbi:unnamed protein product [Paramecium sonneborni]|uniref:PCI domain-containing protein n=1 Tax=Paramecium sonneborni TaxID=65129 RepID=A0A8S1R2I7_9CILI|nr:unnamed protein product [Paramecium sonneborni]